MFAYSAIMFAAAVLFISLAIAIYHGNTNLIHDYHQVKVKEADKAEYGKSFSKGLFAVAASLVFSGVIALFGETVFVVLASVSVLLIGLVISFIMLASVQKRFNSGF